MTLSLYKFMIIGLNGAIGLTLFLFNLSWNEITAIGTDVDIVREDVAYIKGQLDRYWPEDIEQTP